MKIRSILKFIAPAIVACLLNACSSNVEESDFNSLTTEQRIAKLQSLNELEQTGKIALISRYKPARIALNSIYHYTKKSFSLEFTGPMGMSYAKLEAFANGTTFINVRGQVFKGDNARQLLKDEFNLDIPVEDLPSIMLGTPKGEVIYDAQGYPKEATVNDQYKVTYKEFRAYRGGYVLPKSIDILTPYTQIVVKVNDVTRIN